ncbi:MAG: sulfotransferase domain-containing protein [Nanoarchaeota archaeon]
MAILCKKCREKGLEFTAPEDLDVLVCSYGGVGTTLFIDFISKYKRVNCVDDCDRYKHLINPPNVQKKCFKAIYLFGDPIASLISLFRRNYQNAHAEKIMDIEDWDKIASLENIDKYASEEYDLFKFKRHFDLWKNSKTDYPVLFVKFEDLWKNMGKILDFLEIPKSALQDFPKQRERESKLSSLDKKTAESLKRIYGKFAEQIKREKSLFFNKYKKKNEIIGKKKVNLLIQYYKDDMPERQKELEECIKRNINDNGIDRIFMFFPKEVNASHIKSKKVKKIFLRKQLTYWDCFNFANSRLSGDICVIANTDIYFDESLAIVSRANFRNLLIALTRHDIMPDGSAGLMKNPVKRDKEYKKIDPAHSQDVWIFRPPIVKSESNFIMGRAGCERALARELLNKKINVINPSLIIKTYHLHLTQKRNPEFNESYIKREIVSPLPPSNVIPLDYYPELKEVSNIKEMVEFIKKMKISLSV